MLKKQNRLTQSKDFANVYKKGRKVVGSFLVVYAVQSHAMKTRIGFSVSKKVGNAVERNLIKRRLREIARKLAVVESSGHDLVIVARSKSKKANFCALQEELIDLLCQLGLSD